MTAGEAAQSAIEPKTAKPIVAKTSELKLKSKQSKRKKKDKEADVTFEEEPETKNDKKKKKNRDRDDVEKTVDEDALTTSPSAKKNARMKDVALRKKLDTMKMKTKSKVKGISAESVSTDDRSKEDGKDNPYEDKESVKASKKPYERLMEAEQKSLARLDWYHGLMSRDAVEDLLKKDGDFCLRKTDVGRRERYAVSVRWGDHVRHLLPRLNSENKWTIRDDKINYDKLEKLIVFYITSKAELQPCGTKLLNPLTRPEWYILHEHVNLKKKLGSGNFGDVFLAELCVKKSDKTPAAVKTLRGKLGKAERVQFVKEASLMRRFNHENIVRILGVAPQQEPIMIVLELASGGCLKSHCRDKVDLTVDKLTRYCLDAANGMEYLSEHLVIHRDIAARNCLLGDNNVVKISDFGLSVADHSEVKESMLRNVPVKWLAPETLNKGIFTTKSDVWSFGIMMWEVYSRCKKDPYPGMTNKETRAMVLTDARMDAPPETPKTSADVMTLCWSAKPEDRPEWKEIVRRLSEAVGVESQKVQKLKDDVKDGPAEDQYVDLAIGKPS